MRKQRISTFAFIVALLAFLSGCKTDLALRDFDSDYYWRGTSRLAGTSSPIELSTLANDAASAKTERCRAVAQLIGTHIKPGFGSQAIGAVLVNPKWLDECVMRPAGSSGGQHATYSPVGTARYNLALFADEKGWSAWNIELVVTDGPKGALTLEEVRSFLLGRHPDKALKLIEFAIIYPLGSESNVLETPLAIERFTPRGVGLQLIAPR
jgi:hypothetical protein